jgi:hypothetical protein
MLYLHAAIADVKYKRNKESNYIRGETQVGLVLLVFHKYVNLEQRTGARILAGQNYRTALYRTSL